MNTFSMRPTRYSVIVDGVQLDSAQCRVELDFTGAEEQDAECYTVYYSPDGEEQDALADFLDRDDAERFLLIKRAAAREPLGVAGRERIIDLFGMGRLADSLWAMRHGG